MEESTTISSPSAEAVAWAAGLFEGEGCLGVYDRKGSGKGAPKVSVMLRLAMTDRDVVERFQTVVGCGTVREHPPQMEHWKLVYDWQAQSITDVRRVIAMFLPYLGERRRAKALEVLDRAKDVRAHGDKNLECPQGHPLTGGNLRFETIRRGERVYEARRCVTCRQREARDRKRRQLDIAPDRYRVEELRIGA